MTTELSRRNALLYLSILTAAGLSACARDPRSRTIRAATPIPTNTDSPEIISTPLPTIVPSPSPTESPEFSLYPEIHRRYQQLILSEISKHPEFDRLKLYIKPTLFPDYSISYQNNVIEPSASTIKAPILLYALTRQPYLPIYPSPGPSKPASDAYRMIVSSNNSATARLLSSVASSPDQALNEFNDFLHQVLLWPSDTGLTRWGYAPTAGVFTNRVDNHSDFENPLTLDLLADFFIKLNSNFFGDVTSIAQQVMSIPDPDYVTQLDRAVARAQQRYPNLNFSYYGKNGTISPADWQYHFWHLSEAAVISLQSVATTSSIVLTYSASTFDTDTLLDLSLDYGVALHQS